MRERVFEALMTLQALRIVKDRERRYLLRKVGLSISDSAQVKYGVTFKSPRVVIGERCFINVNCIFEGTEHVELEAGAHLAPGVQLLTATHAIGGAWQRAGTPQGAPITIGRGAWVGAGAIVLPGITIGEGCVVGAGSIVTRDTTPDSLWIGQPARAVRSLTP